MVFVPWRLKPFFSTLQGDGHLQDFPCTQAAQDGPTINLFGYHKVTKGATYI